MSTRYEAAPSGRKETGMAHPYHHSVSSARRFGGTPEQYQAIHDWFDATKEMFGDFRNRAMRHHTHGIYECERVFGTTITITLKNGNTKEVPTRLIAEQHVVEDLGRLYTAADWLRCIRPESWMNRPRKLSRELEKSEVPFPSALDRTGSNNPSPPTDLAPSAPMEPNSDRLPVLANPTKKEVTTP